MPELVVSGKYFAIQGHCTHVGGKLWEGKLDGTVVTCPLHASRFDLTDGHVIRWTNWGGLRLVLAKVFKPPRPLKTYKVEVQDKQIMVAIK
jgi:3-phenylpropionate/trans-cinnamate dioxygenase ferredoxin subunit